MSKNEKPKNEEIAQFSNRAKLFFKRGKRLQNEYESKENIDRKYKQLKSDTYKWRSKNKKALTCKDFVNVCSNIERRFIPSLRLG